MTPEPGLPGDRDLVRAGGPALEQVRLAAYLLFALAICYAAFTILHTFAREADGPRLMKAAVPVDATAPAPDAVGAIVAATGPLLADGRLGDEYMGGPYVTLDRSAEMFAWVQTRHRYQVKRGGAMETVETVGYERRWTALPPRSDEFRTPAGHENPAMPIAARSWTAGTVRLGALRVDPSERSLPSATPVALEPAQVKQGRPDGGFLYLGAARPESPRVGDVRLSYRAVAPGGQYTVFGRLADAGTLAPAADGPPGGYALHDGTRAEVLARYDRTEQLLTFILLGWFMLLCGVGYALIPLHRLFGVPAVVGRRGLGAAFLLAIPCSAALTLVALAALRFTGSLYAMIAAGALLAAAGLVASRPRRAERSLIEGGPPHVA